MKKAPAWITSIKNVMSDTKVKDAIRFSSGVFKEVEPLLKQPSWWNIARASVGIVKIYIDEYEIWPDTFFEMGNWNTLFEYSISSIIIGCISSFEHMDIRTGDDNIVVRVHDLGKFKLGYSYSLKLKLSTGSIHVLGDEDEARAFISKRLWDKFGSKNVVLTRDGAKSRHSESQSTIVIDESVTALPSERASKLSAYVKRFNEAGINRSIMFYGPPGTGKSTLARALIAELGYNSLRVRVEDLRYIDNTGIAEIFALLKPDAVILDDFDRADSQMHLLETLEQFSRKTKLVIATVNDRSQLDSAILRPGRFDEMVLVDQMDEAVIKHMLTPAFEDALSDVRDWPIAFINEYVKRRQVLTKAEANESMDELLKRIIRLESSTHKRGIDDSEEKFLERKKKQLNIRDEVDSEAERDEEDDKFGPKAMMKEEDDD